MSRQPLCSARVGRLFLLLEASFYVTVFLTDGLFAQVLSSFGYGDGFIGVVLMAMGIAGFAMQPLFGVFCDRTRNYRALFLTVFAALTLSYPFLFRLRDSRTAVLIFAALCLAAVKPMYTVLDSWIGKLQKEYPLDYGRLRSCGSISYALSSAALAPLIGRFGFESISILLFASVAVLCAAVFLLPNPAQFEEERGATLRDAARALFGNPRYRLLLVFGFLVGLSNNATLLFSARYISSLGGGVGAIGAANFVMAGSEFFVIKNYSKIADRFGTARAFGFGMLCTAGRLLLFSLAPNATVGILLFLTQAVSFALLIPGAVRYLSELVPRAYLASAMLLYQAISLSLAQIIGSPVFGALAERYSVKAMFAMVSVPGLIGAVAFLLTSGRRTARPDSAAPSTAAAAAELPDAPEAAEEPSEVPAQATPAGLSEVPAQETASEPSELPAPATASDGTDAAETRAKCPCAAPADDAD